MPRQLHTQPPRPLKPSTGCSVANLSCHRQAHTRRPAAMQPQDRTQQTATKACRELPATPPAEGHHQTNHRLSTTSQTNRGNTYRVCTTTPVLALVLVLQGPLLYWLPHGRTNTGIALCHHRHCRHVAHTNLNTQPALGLRLNTTSPLLSAFLSAPFLHRADTLLA
jgi:hypothetical protein